MTATMIRLILRIVIHIGKVALKKHIFISGEFQEIRLGITALPCVEIMAAF